MTKFVLFLFCSLCSAQTFTITGTVIPTQLLKLNYGRMPKNVLGLDFNICNTSGNKGDLTSGQVYQALLEQQPTLQPIGGTIMLAAILHNQNNSLKSWLVIGLNATTGVLSVLGTSKAVNISSGWTTGLSVGSLVAQSILNAIDPALTANQVQTFQSTVMPTQMILDGGSCIERTVFVANTGISKAPALKNMLLKMNVQ